MKECNAMIKRNVKLFFKDKGTFFTALITPMILLVLYATFLYNVYYTSFESAIPVGVVYDKAVLDGLVGGLMLSSLLAVSAVTVSFCANLISVQDKATGARKDLTVTPIKAHTLAIGYYVSTAINGLLISLIALGGGLVYLACTGWYLSVTDVLLLFSDAAILVLFGTALSALICYPLTTQGQLSAVGSIVSAGYGFVCGAYMPISQFSQSVQNVMMFFPGTYGTSLVRNHALSGACEDMLAQGLPAEMVEGIYDLADCNLYFFENKVPSWTPYVVLFGTIALLVGGYILLNVLRAKKASKK